MFTIRIKTLAATEIKISDPVTEVGVAYGSFHIDLKKTENSQNPRLNFIKSHIPE